MTAINDSGMLAAVGNAMATTFKKVYLILPLDSSTA